MKKPRDISLRAMGCLGAMRAKRSEIAWMPPFADLPPPPGVMLNLPPGNMLDVSPPLGDNWKNSRYSAT